MTVSYQPWYTTTTYPSWDIPLNTDAGPDDLTGVDITTFVMIFRNTQVSPVVDTPGTGTFSIKVAYPAEILYKPSPADVASAFTGELVIRAGFPPSNGAADQVEYDPIMPFVITQK